MDSAFEFSNLQASTLNQIFDLQIARCERFIVRQFLLEQFEQTRLWHTQMIEVGAYLQIPQVERQIEWEDFLAELYIGILVRVFRISAQLSGR